MTGRHLQRVLWGLTSLFVVAAFFIGLTGGDTAPQTDVERAFAIKETTLCPVCQGQNVLESNAPTATAIRSLIDERVEEGATDAEIRFELASIYGADVNATPPSSGWGSLVWILPVAGVIVAAGGLGFSIRRWRLQGVRRADEADVELVESARQSGR